MIKKQIVSFLYLLAITKALNDNFISFGVVVGRSMQPTFNPNGNEKTPVLISRFYTEKSLNSIKKGDILVYSSPREPDTISIKRVVALEGDLIKNTPVPKGYLWFEGDNKYLSLDSRDYGPVSKGLLRGKVILSLFPFKYFN